MCIYRAPGTYNDTKNASVCSHDTLHTMMQNRPHFHAIRNPTMAACNLLNSAIGSMICIQLKLLACSAAQQRTGTSILTIVSETAGVARLRLYIWRD